MHLVIKWVVHIISQVSLRVGCICSFALLVIHVEVRRGVGTHTELPTIELNALDSASVLCPANHVCIRRFVYIFRVYLCIQVQIHEVPGIQVQPRASVRACVSINYLSVAV